MSIVMDITLKDLPKISLNEWYAGKHWTERSDLKKSYIWLVRNQFKEKPFPKTGLYEVSYDFVFKNNALDASNCIAMVKMIEDIIFESDAPKVIKKISISSSKGKSDVVYIEVKIIE
jgi:hypothetical protein